MLNADEVRQIVGEVLAAQRHERVEQADADALKAVATILTSFGIEEDDRKELRADFLHLRKWRQSVEQVERVGWGAIVTVLVTGTLGALWVGIKVALGK
jgi:hypothetical protein